MPNEIKHDYEVHELPMSEVYCDNAFNCRGVIVPADCVDLAHSIRERGLDQPIMVQPYDKIPGKRYRIINGHRRFTACKILERQFIQAFIRTDFTEETARTQNLIENLHRKDLNIKQEADSLKWYFDSGFQDKMIATVLGMSQTWVTARKELLRLPDDIQAAAASGILTQEQIRLAAKMKTKEEQYEYVRKIKDMRAKGERFRIVSNLKSKEETFRARERKKAEIEQMVEMLMDTWPEGTLASRFGAWCAGNIDTLTFMFDVQKAAADEDKSFIIPAEIREGALL